MAYPLRPSVLLCLLCISMRCSSAFHQHHTFITPLSKPFHWAQESTCIYSSTSGSADNKSIYGISISDNDDAQEYKGENNDAGVELWLDLRGTSLTPKAALELWHLQERENNQQQLLNENDTDTLAKIPFVKCLVSHNKKSRGSSPENSNDENEQNIDILLVAENDGEEMNSILQQADILPSSTRVLDCIGRVLSLQASSSSMPILPDPLPAMEVASRGEWLIVDTNGWKKVSEEDRISMVLPLIELISSGAPGGSTVGGGIGLTCHTNNEIVKAAMFIQSKTNIGGGGVVGNVCTKTLKSGIVIPDDDAGIGFETESGMRNSDSTNFALVIPYDLELLKTAKLLFGDP